MKNDKALNTASITAEGDTQDDALESGKGSASLPDAAPQNAESLTKEINGPKGLEPTRYGDWEANGRCYDF